ncbi:homoserine dehydrogenase [Georgenia sp. H159]|uniref:homoserine dehydrogenase n=1 Tax=Georgenia sp. H159 TaxID=3076115 RepID=UPI002D797D4B|nr:homoserine dehydrogenase [Georgenia sp. H159]
MSERALRVAVLGCGTVGTEVVRLLHEQAADLTARTGARLEVVGIAVRDTTAPRAEVVDTRLLTTDAAGLVRRADLVIELVGGIEPARSLVLEALGSGASVVTANKALLAAHGPELYEAAESAGVDLYFEAAVAGAVPVVRGVRESFAGDRVDRVLGVVNGTTNFILDEMTSRGVGFGEALADAQALGYAEADPTADIDGHDAAAKIAILASLAFHTRVSIDDVPVEGIRYVTAADVEAAGRGKHVIKLLAIAERRMTTDGEGISVRVHPALLPLDHPLAAVHGAYNAVVVDTEAAGRLMFYGQGAGGAPTASAVLGDVVAAGRNRVSGGRGPSESRYAALPLLGGDQVTTQFQLRLEVADVPGVLAAIAGTFGEHKISIQTVTQEQASAVDGAAVLIVVTHRASEAALAATADAVARIPSVKRVLAVTRVEDV